MDTYYLLFIDSLLASLILPIKGEAILHAILIFNSHSLYNIILVVCVATLVGLMINWQVGKTLIFLKKTKPFQEKQSQLDNIQSVWNKYIIWILPFVVATAIGPVICLFCGFFKVRLWKVAYLALIGKLLYIIAVAQYI